MKFGSKPLGRNKLMNNSSAKKRILITGASGLIGSELSLALLLKNWELVILGRSSEKSFKTNFTLPCEYYQWADSTHSEPPKSALKVDCVLNLMGEPIANRRWTENQKVKLRDSRILSTKNLVDALKKYNPSLKSFVSSSAIGIYGEGGNKFLSENSPGSNDFLGTLCSDWEFEALKAPGRTVIIRTGIVLSNSGGALEKMRPVFEKSLGGRLSNGKHWMSWIHIEDLINIYLAAIENPTYHGAYNAVAPEPVTNTEFTYSLAQHLKVRVFLPVPKFILKLGMGEMAQMLLCSQRVKPEALESQKFNFKFQRLESALKNLYSWKKSRHDRLFQSSQWVSQPRSKVFPFFSEVKNLEILTPAFLNFHVLKKSTEQIQSGTIIDYKLNIHGIPVKWRSQICNWQPEQEFSDIQLKGPYKKWDHTHGFLELAEGTLLTDKVIYRMPLAEIGGNLAKPIVANDIKKIFSFRKQKILELFGSSVSK